MRAKARRVDQDPGLNFSVSGSNLMALLYNADFLNFTVKIELSAVSLCILRQTLYQRLDADDANRRNEDSSESANRRNFAHAFRRHGKPKWNVLPSALSPQIPEPVRFSPNPSAEASRRKSDQHANPGEGNIVRFGIFDD